MKHRPLQRSQSFNSPAIQPLEERRLMSGATIGIYAAQNASETRPTTSGRGVFEFKRAVGSVAHSITLGYTLRSSSTTTTADYATLSGLVTIPAGARTAAINVNPIDDSLVEGTEKLDLTLTSRSGYTNVHSFAEITIADNDSNVTPSSAWFGGTRTSRTSFTMNAGSYARSDEPLDFSINFTNALTALGKSGSLQDNSIQVVETNAAGDTAVNSNVPYQFDHATSGYNAASNASGDLVVQPTGATAASTTRYFQIYFDTTSGFTAPSFTSHVATTDNTPDGTTDPNGNPINSVKIDTDNATYYFQKGEGAFSRIVDKSGNDWVSWNGQNGDDAGTGSGGRFRGLPNLGSLGFHPYRNHNVTTTIVASGPLKTVLQAQNTAGDKVEWEFYSTFARLTVTPHDNTQGYMMLYEGTPGGGINSSDTVTRSNGVTTDINTTTDAAIGGGSGVGADEFIYFRDSAVGTSGRYLFLTHNNKDNLEDDYYEMHDSTGDMTVFGFGRQNTGGGTNQLITGVNTFTIGLADGGADFNSTAANIEGQYQPLTLAAGTPASKPA